MDTTLITEVLTDSSKVYSLAFTDGSNKTLIACESLDSAYALKDALDQYAVYAIIENA